MHSTFLNSQINGISENYFTTRILANDYIASPFEITLTIACENPMTIRSILNQNASVQIGHDNDNPIFYHGIISTAKKIKPEFEAYHSYQITIKPEIFKLANDRLSKTYAVDQPQTASSVVISLLKQYQHSTVQTNLSKNYPQQNNLIQLDETSLNFISRTLFDAGIYYYYKHDQNQSTLNLFDQTFIPANQTQVAQYQPEADRPGYALYSWEAKYQRFNANQKSQVFAYEKADTLIEHDQAQSQTAFQSHNLSDQVFTTEPMTDESHLASQIKNKLNTHISKSLRIKTRGTVPAQSGDMVRLISDSHLHQENDYIVIASFHDAKDKTYESTLVLQPALQSFTPGARYLNDIQPINIKPQLAKVIGPKNQKINTDKLGRVKIQYQNSAIWARVRQAWSGEQVGTQFIPRIGQEVLIDFENNDLTQPIVIATLDNSEQLPPFNPDKTPLQTGIKTEAHTIVFDDDKNKPAVSFETQRDMHYDTTQSQKTMAAQNQLIDIIKGHFHHTSGGQFSIKSNETIHLICGDSEIIIDSQGVTLQSDKIVLDQGGSNTQKVTGNTPVNLKTLLENLSPSQACHFTQLILSCQHGHRSFKLDAIHGKATREQQYVLQVLAGTDKPDQLKLQFSGTCTKGAENCAKVVVRSDNNVTEYASSTSIPVYSKALPSRRKDFAEFFETILIPNSNPNVYVVSPLSCSPSNAHEVTVEAYTPVEWSGLVTLGVNNPQIIKLNGAGKEGNKVIADWELSGEININYNDTHWKLNSNTTQSTPFDTIKAFMNNIVPKLALLKKYSGGAASFNVELPNISLKGDVQNKELKNKYIVDSVGSIDVEFNPLIGLMGSIDAVQWIIDMFPETKLATLLRKVQKTGSSDKASKDISANLEAKMILSANATLSGKLAWQKALSDDWQMKTKDELDDTLAITLEGDAYGSVKYFSFEAGAGIRAGISSAIIAKIKSAEVNSQEVVAKAELEFTGMKVYWATYTYVNHGKKTGAQRNAMPPNKQNKVLDHTLESAHNQTIIKPKKLKRLFKLQNGTL